MDKYKVIKEFASAKKGDILEYDGELFVLDINDEKSCRYMAMDEDTADEFVEKGYLEWVQEEDEADCTDECECGACSKLGQIEETIRVLKEQYKNDHDAIEEKYNNQELPACVKVEADTVYFNMNQILNKIEEIINE